MDKIALAYAGFLGRVDAILDTRGEALECQDLPHFDWYQAFVIGQEPSDAVAQALRTRPLPGREV